MSKVSIDTPQNVSIDYELASIGHRIVATLLDWLIIAGYAFAISMLAAYLFPSVFNNTLGTLFIYLPIITYDFYMEILTGGKSIGKQVMKIQVVKVDGSQATVGDYFLRWIFRLIDSLIYFWTIGLFSIIASEKSQRLGDLAANTIVVRTSQKTRIYDTILHYQNKEIKVTFTQVIHLNDRDISIIKELIPLIRLPENSLIREKLTQKVKQVTGIETTMDDLTFLNHIVRDYSNYDFNIG
jgi:uncharacterized RDD family membrane protein YckC